MELGIAGQVFLVAGASRGIGLGIAEALLEEGARVGIAARGAEALEQTRDELRKRYGDDAVWAAAGDLRVTADIDAIVEACEAELGPLAGAVANVGISDWPTWPEVDDEVWQAGLDQNLTSALRLARSVTLRMQPRGKGSIVFISSISGLNTSGDIVYATGKAAMNHLGRELARHAGTNGIRVNVVAPGNIYFPGGVWDIDLDENPSVAEHIRREVPLGRFGTPAEIGSVVCFLLSDRASFVNGAVLPVDGGQIR